MVLDLSTYYTDHFPEPKGSNSKSINGEKTFDGIPFRVRGRAVLYGQNDAARQERPDLKGIEVGRRFDELHLLHTTRWPDFEGRTIARIRLNYEDGTHETMAIGYGLHVRDWQRLHSESKEAVDDPHSKLVWRGPGQERFKATERMFKSMFINPQPKKLVKTIDITSTGQLASYSLSAATVADRGFANPETLSKPPTGRAEYDFDGRLEIQVVDGDGRPIKGAWVSGSLLYPGAEVYTVCRPLRTSADGTATLTYPAEWAKRIHIFAGKDGWERSGQYIRIGGSSGWDPGTTVTMRLLPEE